MISNAHNHSAAGGALVTVVPETVDAVDDRVKHKRNPTDHYKPEAFPTKPKRDKVKNKVYIRGFYVVVTEPDTKLPHIDRVKFVYTYVVS
jgi:hypothetical protein